MSSVGERDSLGRTIIAYRGHITRIINELDPLLLEQIASKEVVEKHSSLVSIFEKLKRACAQWYHLSGEQEDRERITHDYAKDVYRMPMFENKYKEWLNDVYTPISRGVYGEGIANISGFDLSSKTPVVRLEGVFQGTQNTNPSVSARARVVICWKRKHLMRLKIMQVAAIRRQVNCTQGKGVLKEGVSYRHGMSSVQWLSLK